MPGDDPPASAPHADAARRALGEAEELAAAGDDLAEDGELEAAEAAFLAALDKVLTAPGTGAGDDGAAESGDSAIVPRLYRALGEVSFLAGNYEAALDWLVRACDLDEENQRPLALALDLTNTGVVRRHMGDLDGALADYRRVAEIEQQHDVSSVDRAISLNNMGRIYQVKGDINAAQGLFDEALSLLDGTDAETTVIRANFLGNLAGLQLDRGAFASAVALYRQALDLVLAAAPRSKDTATCHNNLGYAYAALGDPGRALDQYQSAYRIDRRLAPRSLSTARDLNNIAGIHRDAGRLTQARRCYERARAILRATAPHSAEMAACLNNLGGIRDLQGDPAGALRYYRRALDIDSTAAPGSGLLATDLSNIGEVLRNRGRLAEALDYAERALEIERAIAPESPDLATFLVNVAMVRSDLGDQTAAIADLERAVQVSESLRARAGADWARERMLAQNESAHITLVGWLYERADPGDHDSAFTVAERFRARVLLDLLGERELGVRPRTAEQRHLLAEERDLSHLAAATHQRRREAAEDGLTQAAAHLSEQEHEQAERLDRVRARIRDVFPDYADLKAPVPITVQQLQHHLHRGELLLAYLLTPGDSYVWAVSTTGASMFPLRCSTQELADTVDAALAAYRAGERGDIGTADAQRELAQAVLGTVPPHILRGARHLIVVPDGALAYLPFELLPAPGGDLLIDQHVISYCPSATIFATLRQRRQQSARPRSWRSRAFIGFGDPVLADSSPLPGARGEVESLVNSFGAQAAGYTGREATEFRVRHLASGYRHVHLATHAVLDDANPLYSGLMLSPPTASEIAASDEHLDGLLQVHEMFSLRLRAETVVCTGCQTGLGQIHAGEGLISMSRALLFAGAESVALTLWPVADSPTRRLTLRFYAEMRAGLPPGRALAAAKRSLRRTHPHLYADPFTWASLVVIGER
jgi:CHAT domain-containing protein/tetratricopeptide (TPR) repeat protein